MRDRSSRSSIRRASRATLRRIISSTVRKAVGRRGVVEHRRRGGEDGGQRRAELVAQRGQEAVLGPVGRLGFGPGRSRSISASASARAACSRSIRTRSSSARLRSVISRRTRTHRTAGAAPSREIRASKDDAGPSPGPSSSKLASPARSIRLQPIGQRRPRGERPRRLDGQDISRRPPDQPLGGRISSTIRPGASITTTGSLSARRPSPTRPASGPAAGIATGRGRTPARSQRSSPRPYRRRKLRRHETCQ